MHQHVIDSQSMQPRGERRFTAKAFNLAKKVNKNLLRKILRFGSVLSHAEANVIDAAVMCEVDLVKIPLLGIAKWLLFTRVLHHTLPFNLRILVRTSGMLLSQSCSNYLQLAESRFNAEGVEVAGPVSRQGAGEEPVEAGEGD